MCVKIGRSLLPFWAKGVGNTGGKPGTSNVWGLDDALPQVGDNIITTVKGNRRRGCEGKQTDGRKHLHFLFFNKLEWNPSVFLWGVWSSWKVRHPAKKKKKKTTHSRGRNCEERYISSNQTLPCPSNRAEVDRRVATVALSEGLEPCYSAAAATGNKVCGLQTTGLKKNGSRLHKENENTRAFQISLLLAMVVFNKGEKKSDCRKVKEPQQQHLICDLSSGVVVCIKSKKKKLAQIHTEIWDPYTLNIKQPRFLLDCAGSCAGSRLTMCSCVCGRVLRHVCL